MLGGLLNETGKPAEAEAECRMAVAIWQKLADDDPKTPKYRNDLAWAHSNLGNVLQSLGRAAEARDSHERGIVLRQRLVQEDPTTAQYRGGLAWSLLRRGLARRDLGDAAGAAADARSALELYEALPSRSGEEWLETACCHAALCGLSGHAGAGVSVAQGKEEADRAIGAPTRAAGLGYRNAYAWRTQSALDPLRSRDDFRLLMMDLAFPAEAFAATR